MYHNVIFNEKRLGMVSTSRSGCTYFRKRLCNDFGLEDSGSWLKQNEYQQIEEAKFSKHPHILKIKIHYIPENDLEFVLRQFPKIWLWREDTIRQFMSHIARLRTKINHVYDINDQPQIKDKSLTATRSEFDLFMYRQKLFWNAWKTIGFIKNEPLIKFEDFLNNPNNIYDHLYDWFYFYMTSNGVVNIQLPQKIEIDYKEKFANYETIVNWFDE
jgi:hypothetical protein|tara:strand:- start:868 stop:1512 length:645 start_codon:yes stop_codon:yes gene_type:complete